MKSDKILAPGKIGSMELKNRFVVPPMGVKSNNPLEETVKAMGKECFVVGDASKAGPANQATEAGLAAALAL